MYIEGLDELDNRILHCIEKNARMTYQEIGEAVGVSRVAVKNHMDSLIEKGIIRGFYAAIDPSKLPSGTQFFLDIETSPEAYLDVVDALNHSTMIRQIYSVSGECRLHAVGFAPNGIQLANFANRLYKDVKGVRRIGCHTVLSTLKDMDKGVEYVRCEEYECVEGKIK